MYNVIVTAGGTSESIDQVRKITNSSTGKLGVEICRELLKRNDINMIYYIKARKALMPPDNDDRICVIDIESTMDLKTVVEQTLKTERIDYMIHSMAVSDYMVSYVSTAEMIADEIDDRGGSGIEETLLDPENRLDNRSKLSSNANNLIVCLKPTPKIIGLVKKISPATHLFGFKLLDGVSEQELINVATNLKNKNNCDMVIANDLKNIRNGNHKAFLVENDTVSEVNGKENIAKAIVKRIGQ